MVSCPLTRTFANRWSNSWRSGGIGWRRRTLGWRTWWWCNNWLLSKPPVPNPVLMKDALEFRPPFIVVAGLMTGFFRAVLLESWSSWWWLLFAAAAAACFDTPIPMVNIPVILILTAQSHRPNWRIGFIHYLHLSLLENTHECTALTWWNINGNSS